MLGFNFVCILWVFLIIFLFFLGTISGVEKGSYGSMLELAWSGKEPIKLSESEERTFINDGDILNIKGFAEKNG